MEESKQNNVMAVVKSYGTRLFDFIRGRVNSREDAEDVLQDVWFQLSNIVDVEAINSMSGWLHRVAKNKLADRYRKKKDLPINSSIGEEEDSPGNLFPSFDDSPETIQFKELFWEELMDALDELPENQKEVFIWNELEDRTLQEIADRTGENLKTIISRKRYAVKHLRNRLADLYNDLNSL